MRRPMIVGLYNVPCFSDLLTIVIEVDVVTVATVGDHLSAQHQTVRAGLTSREGSCRDVQRGPVHRRLVQYE